MSERADSFDGRYFGVSKQADVIGKARLLWAR
jgi:type IV secretory pathway protease TraF